MRQDAEAIERTARLHLDRELQEGRVTDAVATSDDVLRAIPASSLPSAAGRASQRIALKLDTFLPQTAIQYPVLVEKQALGAGQYRARVELAYGTSGSTTSEVVAALVVSASRQFSASRGLVSP